MQDKARYFHNLHRERENTLEKLDVYENEHNEWRTVDASALENMPT